MYTLTHRVREVNGKLAPIALNKVTRRGLLRAIHASWEDHNE